MLQAKSNHRSNADNAERIVSAMERILRPVIRLFVGRISCGFMVQQIKRIYIDEARRWIEKNDANARVTQSKLAMLTGLDTRTISAIENSQFSDNIEGELCAETAVLYRWVSQSDYQDESGEPKLLPIMGRSHTFQSLVNAAVGRNVTCQTVLDRLLESGNVEVVDENFAKLVSPYYQPIKSSEQMIIDSGSVSISRLTDTIANNLNSKEKESRKLQQDRFSRNIPVECLPELSQKIRSALGDQILEIEQIIDAYEVKDGDRDVRTVGVGWYVFS